LTLKKFSREDQAYFTRRDRFAAKYSDAGFWFIADNWPLFAGIANIGRFLAIYDLIRDVIDLPGHFCELGCWNGANLVYMAKIIRILQPHSCTEIIGFDSFKGLETFVNGKDDSRHEKKNTYKGNVRLLEDAIKLYNMDEHVRLVKGDIRKTLPKFLKARKDIRFSFVYLDLDLYAPTKLGIELLYPRLLKGGIMAFDNYNTEDWPGETSAVHEVLGDKVPIHGSPFSRQPRAYIIKESEST
jgi:hypothetical protein